MWAYAGPGFLLEAEVLGEEVPQIMEAELSNDGCPAIIPLDAEGRIVTVNKQPLVLQLAQRVRRDASVEPPIGQVRLILTAATAGSTRRVPFTVSLPILPSPFFPP